MRFSRLLVAATLAIAGLTMQTSSAATVTSGTIAVPYAGGRVLGAELGAYIAGGCAGHYNNAQFQAVINLSNLRGRTIKITAKSANPQLSAISIPVSILEKCDYVSTMTSPSSQVGMKTIGGALGGRPFQFTATTPYVVLNHAGPANLNQQYLVEVL
jgi:hypothetical protein